MVCRSKGEGFKGLGGGLRASWVKRLGFRVWFLLLCFFCFVLFFFFFFLGGGGG